MTRITFNWLQRSCQSEKLLPRISESIRKASFLRHLNFCEQLGFGGLPLLQGQGRLLCCCIIEASKHLQRLQPQMGRDRLAYYNCGPFYNSGFVCLRAGPVRGSSGENEKLLPRISEAIRKASFLRYLNFWQKLGFGGLPLLKGQGRLLCCCIIEASKQKQRLQAQMGQDRPASYNCGPLYNSGFVCLRAGPVRGSSGENEKLLPRISEAIRKASFLRYLNFWQNFGFGGLPLLKGQGRLLCCCIIEASKQKQRLQAQMGRHRPASYNCGPLYKSGFCASGPAP